MTRHSTPWLAVCASGRRSSASKSRGWGVPTLENGIPSRYTFCGCPSEEAGGRRGRRIGLFPHSPKCAMLNVRTAVPALVFSAPRHREMHPFPQTGPPLDSSTKHIRRRATFQRAIGVAGVVGTLALSSACSWPTTDSTSPLGARAAAAPRFPAECFEPESIRAHDSANAATEGGGVINTHLYAWKTEVLDVGAGIGAVEALCQDLVVATMQGHILHVTPGGAVQRIGGVPMNLAAFRAHPDFNEKRLDRFRVHDILLQPRGSGRWRVFATHHYLAQECIRFRLSVTSISREGDKVVLSPDWHTVFDAEPCLPTNYNGGQNSGGKMVSDGPAHVLLAIGDHGWEGSDDAWPDMNAPWELISPQVPHSHLGKLLRIAIETGETETLASGLRNPQGLAVDRQGNLWETEHGPHGGDELNLMLRGSNYGWPFVSYGIGYEGFVSGHDAARVLRHEEYAKPVFAWVPSVATAGVLVNDESSFPLWSDDLLVASLKGFLYRVHQDGGSVRYVEEIKLDIPRPRDLTQTSDGRLVLSGVRSLAILQLFPKRCDVAWQTVRRIHSVACDE